MVPAGGMVLVPEGGAGCSCGNWIETSLGFVPRPKSEPTTKPKSADAKKEGK